MDRQAGFSKQSRQSRESEGRPGRQTKAALLITRAFAGVSLDKTIAGGNAVHSRPSRSGVQIVPVHVTHERTVVRIEHPVDECQHCTHDNCPLQRRGLRCAHHHFPHISLSPATWVNNTMAALRKPSPKLSQK
jgi:hypothetical protein